ncbi:MAG: ABC-2 family transporter protein [Firmicutes bacterium]|nr:ABC-2 family transporter protein [Bacillota bacterium]
MRNRSKRGISLKGYMAVLKGSIMQGLSFRASTYLRIAGNLVYLVIIYFLWKAIFASSPTDTVNGMTFYDTMIYLVLAAAMFNFMDTFVVWWIGDDYQTGEIVLYLTKPIDYQPYLFCARFGNCVISFFVTFMPTFIIVYFVTRGSILLGINMLFFVVSILLATAVNFCVDFFVGTICFYTQSVWGVNIMKEVVVSLLSGATIPLAFFPAGLRRVVDVLPFQAIYHIPLHVLTDKTMNIVDYMSSIGIQLLWIAVMLGISRLFWKVSVKGLTVNGG